MTGTMTDEGRVATIKRALHARLGELDIAVEVLPYPAHETVEEGKALRGDMAGTFTKNLALKDKKGRIYLVAAHEDRDIDLKTLHRRIGASGRLGFVPPERMIATLGVGPGALTPLARIADTASEVAVVIDAGLMEAGQLNFHPLVSTQSVGLAPAALLRFLRSCGCEPIIAEMSDAAG